MKNLKWHCKAKKHSKFQNELINIRRDSMHCKEYNLYIINHNQHVLYRIPKNIVKQNNFSRKCKCTYNIIQQAIEHTKNHVYNKISMSDYKEFLETIKIPIKDLIKKQKNKLLYSQAKIYSIKISKVLSMFFLQLELSIINCRRLGDGKMKLCF